MIAPVWPSLPNHNQPPPHQHTPQQTPQHTPHHSHQHSHQHQQLSQHQQLTPQHTPHVPHAYRHSTSSVPMEIMHGHVISSQARASTEAPPTSYMDVDSRNIYTDQSQLSIIKFNNIKYYIISYLSWHILFIKFSIIRDGKK